MFDGEYLLWLYCVGCDLLCSILYYSCFDYICCSSIFGFGVSLLMHGVYDFSHKIVVRYLSISCRTLFALFFTSSIHYIFSMYGVVVCGFSSGGGGGSDGGLYNSTLIAGFYFSSTYICHTLELIYVSLSSDFVLYASALAMCMIGAIS